MRGGNEFQLSITTTTVIMVIDFHFLLRASADAVGEVTSCSDLQLYEYAQLAKAAYGSDVTTWDSATISNVGIVIG